MTRTALLMVFGQDFIVAIVNQFFSHALRISQEELLCVQWCAATTIDVFPARIGLENPCLGIIFPLNFEDIDDLFANIVLQNWEQNLHTPTYLNL